jgi:hypothetical protein
MALRHVVSINTIVYETAVYLAASGVGSLGSTIYYRTLPDTPWECVAVTAETEYQDRLNTMSQLQYQVFVRDRSVGNGLSRAQEVFRLLGGARNIWQTVRGVSEGQGSPGQFYRDQNDVPVWPLNFRWRGQP